MWVFILIVWLLGSGLFLSDWRWPSVWSALLLVCFLPRGKRHWKRGEATAVGVSLWDQVRSWSNFLILRSSRFWNSASTDILCLYSTHHQHYQKHFLIILLFFPFIWLTPDSASRTYSFAYFLLSCWTADLSCLFVFVCCSIYSVALGVTSLSLLSFFAFNFLVKPPWKPRPSFFTLPCYCCCLWLDIIINYIMLVQQTGWLSKSIENKDIKIFAYYPTPMNIYSRDWCCTDGLCNNLELHSSRNDTEPPPSQLTMAHIRASVCIGCICRFHLRLQTNARIDSWNSIYCRLSTCSLCFCTRNRLLRIAVYILSIVPSTRYRSCYRSVINFELFWEAWCSLGRAVRLVWGWLKSWWRDRTIKSA